MADGVASSSTASPPKHLVFLSFSSQDSRATFANHLYHALNQKGFETFRDDDSLKKGRDISVELTKAIEESKVATVVFSRNYASSAWRLMELAKIMECRRKGLLVHPIFYHVDPSDLRNLRGFVGDELNKHKKRHPIEIVESWEHAIKELSQISGFYVKDRNEIDVIEYIVKEVSKIFDPILLSNRFEVFLSFRGDDTRYNFTSHLNDALERKGYKVFMDEESLEGGKKLGKQLSEAIKGSKFAVVVFSKRYASSKWCLRELTEIMDRSKKQKLIAYPVFFHVDPSDLRNIRGEFVGEALDEHKKDLELINEVEPWREAVKDLGQIIGEHVTEKKYESAVVKKILEEVSKNIGTPALNGVTKYSAEILSHMKGIEELFKKMRT